MSDAPRDDDIVELGGNQPPAGWRPSRGASVLAAAALAVGLLAGYVAGDHQARGGAPLAETATPRPSASSAAPSASASSVANSQPLTQDTGACSVQSGKHLVLGVHVSNQSTVPVTLKWARAVLPLGGLTQGTWHWAPCGALPETLAQSTEVLQPGASTWLTMTFSVKPGCPAPYPVQFTVGYVAQGRSSATSLPGFPDLSQVPYTGCPRASAAAVSGLLAGLRPVRPAGPGG